MLSRVYAVLSVRCHISGLDKKPAAKRVSMLDSSTATLLLCFGILAKMPVDEFFGEFHTFKFEQLHVFIQSSIQR